MVRNFQNLPWSTTGSVRIVPFCIIESGAWVCWSQQCWPLRGMAPVATSLEYELDGFGDVRCFCWVICSIQRVHFFVRRIEINTTTYWALPVICSQIPMEYINLPISRNESRRHFLSFSIRRFPNFSQVPWIPNFPWSSAAILVHPRRRRRVMFDVPFRAWKTRNTASEVATVVVFYVAGCFMWWFGESLGMFGCVAVIGCCG